MKLNFQSLPEWEPLPDNLEKRKYIMGCFNIQITKLARFTCPIFFFFFSISHFKKKVFPIDQESRKLDNLGSKLILNTTYFVRK